MPVGRNAGWHDLDSVFIFAGCTVDKVGKSQQRYLVAMRKSPAKMCPKTNKSNAEVPFFGISHPSYAPPKTAQILADIL